MLLSSVIMMRKWIEAVELWAMNIVANGDLDECSEAALYWNLPEL